MSAIDEALAMWDVIRKGTISEVENVAEEHWDFRAGDGARTFGEVARHILDAASAFASELLRDDTSFARVTSPEARQQAEEQYPGATKAEVIAQLRAQIAADSQRLRDASLDSKTMQSRGGSQSKLTGLWFAIAHEMYHRGQLATYERAIGVVPAMTQQMQKRK